MRHPPTKTETSPDVEPLLSAHLFLSEPTIGAGRRNLVVASRSQSSYAIPL
jgi:hypothetical protein